MFASRMHSSGVAAVWRLRIEDAVHQIERIQPQEEGDRDWADERDAELHASAECSRTFTTGCQPEQEECRQADEQDEELRVEPWQRGEREPPPCPGRQAFRERLPQPQRGPGGDERSGHLRKNQPRVRKERNGHAHRQPGQQRGAAACDRLREIEHRESGERGDHTDHRQGASIAGNCVCRQKQRRQSGRMNRVDHFMATSLQVVGPELAGKERTIVTPDVVVLDRQIVVDEQAMGDDQVMGFVGARANRRRRQESEAQVDGEADREDRPASRQARIRSGSRTAPPEERRAGRQRSGNRTAGNHPAERPRERKEQWRTIREPWQVRNAPQQQKRQRRDHARERAERRAIARSPPHQRGDRTHRDTRRTKGPPQV